MVAGKLPIFRTGERIYLDVSFCGRELEKLRLSFGKFVFNVISILRSRRLKIVAVKIEIAPLSDNENNPKDAIVAKEVEIWDRILFGD